MRYIFCLNSRDVGPPYHIYTYDHRGPLQIFQKIAVAKLANKCLVAYQGPLILKWKAQKYAWKTFFLRIGSEMLE